MNHAKAATAFNQDEARTTWHDEALWFVRQKRDRMVNTVPEWEALRDAASAIKAHTLSRLDHYLVAFEQAARKHHIQVHWAHDAKAHNEIVGDILRRRNAQRVVKSKSMLTEECGLNHYLKAEGMEVVDTDLGERIVQLAEEPPSHIVLPAIHKKKGEVGALFHENMGTQVGADDPQYLTEAARQDLRRHFLAADAAITGVNFAVAETGSFVICTNEGNADMGVQLAPVHIACMGIEKLIPRMEHLGVFLRLLARSATGQPITTYTSHFQQPQAGKEMHVVIVDNGRTRQLGREDFRASLHCIRCGACMNTCPVYRRSGGHSYGSTVPGPIGAILTPGMDMKKHADLPFASTLCGSCSDVCPVKIDIHAQLYKWRQIIRQEGYLEPGKRWGMKWLGKILARPTWYRAAGRWGRRLLRWTPKGLLRKNPWGATREMPKAPRQSFRDWYLNQPSSTNGSDT